MDNILRNKIIGKLTTYLNRQPTESEIQNGVTDTNLMSWIAKDDIANLSSGVSAVQTQMSKIKII